MAPLPVAVPQQIQRMWRYIEDISGVHDACVDKETEILTTSGWRKLSDGLKKNDRIISYDTIYALNDKTDDLKIGINSTAIWFGDYVGIMVGGLHVVMHVLWLCFGWLNHDGTIFYLFWIVAASLLVYQNYLVAKCEYLRAFNYNMWYGFCMWMAVIGWLLKY